MLPTLRPYQTEFVDRLRSELAKHLRVIACSPTGSGKSTVAKYIFGLLNQKEKVAGQSGYSVIAVHRRGLVDNIADTFDRKPNLPYGLIMSGRKTDWSKRVQVASIDTLLSWYVDGKYQVDTTFDFVAFDESHAHANKFKTFLDFHDVKRAELGLKPAFALGLSATPQAKGLAETYKKIVKGPTVQWLIDNNYLVPFRYFQAKVLGDLSKLKKSGNTFTDASLNEAFKGLAGNLIEDWKAKGECRQTVGFFSRLSHAQEACDTLNRAGISARYVDGKTSDEERRRLFSGLDNFEYQYLCNVGIVDRGTDIPAIGCIQLCTAINSIPRLIQILGRGARPNEGKRDCVARGTLILTHRGLVAIEEICDSDRLWDGNSYVTHGGAICKGTQNVITYLGLTATKDHLVQTNEGWKPFGMCASQQIPIVVTGVGGKAIRKCEDRFARNRMEREGVEEVSFREGSVRYLRRKIHSVARQFTWRKNKRLQDVQSTKAVPNVAVSTGGSAEKSVPKPISRFLRELWWTWNRVQVSLSYSGMSLDREKPRCLQKPTARQNRQRRTLRSWKHSLVNTIAKSITHSSTVSKRFYAQIQTGASIRSIFRCNDNKSSRNGSFFRSNKGQILQPEIIETKREVWDILNAGPFHSFTAQGLLVHNCIVIDHGGSIARLNTFFEDDIEWILEAEREKDLEHEGKPSIACPVCRRMYRGGKCSCGYEPTPKELKEHGLKWAEGKLVEITKKAPKQKTRTCEEMFVSALFQAGRSNRTWKQAWGIAKRESEKQGTKLRVPSEIKVGGRVIKNVPWGHPDADRRVRDLFDGIFS